MDPDTGEVVDAPARLGAGTRQVRRRPHAEGLEEALGHQRPPGRPEPSGDDLAEEAVAEVGVVEPGARRRHPAAAVVGPGQGREVASPRALPPRAAGLALHPRRVRERVADRHVAVADVAQVRGERVVEVEQTLVAGLDDQDGRHRLGDRTDPVLAVEPGRLPGPARPHRAVAVEDRPDDGRQPPLRLGDVEQSLALDAHEGDPRAAPPGQSCANASGGGHAQTRLRSP